jgi:hypothetical protein
VTIARSPRRRQRRLDGGRTEQIGVRLTTEEKQLVESRAAAAGLSAPAWLAAVGTRPPAGRESGPGWTAGMSVKERAAWGTQLLQVARQLRGATNNLNQMARAANATTMLPDQTPQVVAELAAAIARLETVVAALDDGRGDAS